MPEFIIGKCKCGGSVLAEFGFSCSGKPKTSMRCDRCRKVSITIGNNNNLMKLWEGTVSDEYIDRRKLLKKITDIELIISLNRADYKTELIQAVKLYEEAILKAISTEPTADVVEVRHGEWIEFEDNFLDTLYQCSVCKEEFVLIEGTPSENLWSYCPNCGAKMDGFR